MPDARIKTISNLANVLDCFRFRIDNTDHIIDVNKGNMPFEYDQVNIVCPVYAPGTHESDAEKYIIYNVSVYIHDNSYVSYIFRTGISTSLKFC